MNLNDVLDYEWEDSIADVQNSFNNNNYKNIKRVEDSISAEFDFNGFPSYIDIDFFNNKIYRVAIDLNLLEGIEESKFYEIETKLLQYLTKQYGEPDEDGIEDNKKETHYLTWDFKNNCSIIFSSYFSDKYSKLRAIGISYYNDSTFEEMQNSPERLLTQIKNAMESKEYQTVVDIANNLITRHPGLDESVEAQKLSDEANQQIAAIEAEKIRKQQEQEERISTSITIIRDEVEGITWYYDKSARELTGSKMYLYFGKHDTGTITYLRMVINHTYSSSISWLFIKEYIFNIDGTRYRFKPGYRDIDRDNTAYTMWEIVDVSITNNQELQKIVNDIINSTRAILRVSGERYYDDRDITDIEKQGMKNIMATYDYVKNGKIN
jgi:hypothetical protein